MKPSPIALLIDADKPVRRLLRAVLEPQRYRVFEAENGELGTKQAVARRPDVIILDLSLPDQDGLAVLRQLREWNSAPVMILSAQNDEELKVAALDSGANDYLGKPFGTAELLARLRVLQRLMPGEPEGPFYIYGDLHVDIAAHRATVRGRHIDLTPTEEALFYMLVRHAGKLVSCRHLLRSIWGSDSEGKIHELHVYIRSLRRKLRSAADEVLIQTVGSVGYRLLLPLDSPKVPPGKNPAKKLVAHV
jgi:two-component system KDP operon response regulator KdpE